MTLLRVGNPVGGGILIASELGISSYIKVNGVTYRLMDNPAWAGLDAAGRIALLCNNGYPSSTISIGPLSFQKGQVQELVLGGDLAGLTTVPNNFARHFTNLTAVDLSGLSGVISVGYGFLYGCSGLREVNMGTIRAGQIAVNPYSFNNSGSRPIKVLSTEVQNYKNRFEGNTGEGNDGRFVAQ
ncbi:MAG: hypothetical protein LBG84_02310 [Treponema sp.]|jgi:hypothetical protein|nr:hypothetical protein [Treponema sp.]